MCSVPKQSPEMCNKYMRKQNNLFSSLFHKLELVTFFFLFCHKVVF